MSDVDGFLASMMPQLTEADTALHNGDAGPRIALWSRTDPVTLLGAAINRVGADDVLPFFETLAASFSDCSSFEYEVLAAEVSGDLAYVVGIEHTTASVAGRPAAPYQLRVTTVFRREDAEWRIVHRHGSPYDVAGGDVAARLRER